MILSFIIELLIQSGCEAMFLDSHNTIYLSTSPSRLDLLDIVQVCSTYFPTKNLKITSNLFAHDTYITSYIKLRKTFVKFSHLTLNLKLDLYGKKNKNKLKIRLLSQTSVLYLIRHASVILIFALQM